MKANEESAIKPKFTLQPEVWNNQPLIEVFRDDGPIHEFDKHFRFGPRKARLMLECTDSLERFWKKSLGERRLMPSHSIAAINFRGVITVTVNQDFCREKRGFVDVIDFPWIELRAGSTKIGLGYMKSRAIFALQQPLKDWLSLWSEYLDD